MGLRRRQREVNPAVERRFRAMLPDLESLLQAFDGFLCKRGLEPRAWFVYGSFPLETARSSSDIDVGVVLPNGQMGRFYELRGEFFAARPDTVAGHRVEIVVYDTIPGPEWAPGALVLEIER